MFIDFHEDLHVHSTFSDGRGTLADNIADAEARGLRRLGCVDHVRHDTAWVDAFASAVHDRATRTPVQLLVGVETKLLDEDGRLDLPPSLTGVDRVYVADHRLPLGDRALGLGEARRLMAAGDLDGEAVVAALVGATRRALQRRAEDRQRDGLPPDVVIAHLFSMLPKLGLSETDVRAEQVAPLVAVARDAGAWLEVDERWRCPSRRITALFAAAGVPVVASSDAHRPEHIGRWRYLDEVAGSATEEGRSCSA